jgi:hypothetical protein
MFKIAYEFIRAEKSRVSNTLKTRLRQKFERLVEMTKPKIESRTGKDNWIVNLSTVPIPAEVEKILQLGPKFAHTSSRFPYEKIITDVEYVINQVRATEEAKTEVRQRVGVLLTKMKKTKEYKPFNTYITPKERKVAETFLKQNENVVVVKADKGNGTVLLEKEEYRKKMNEHLADLTTYKMVENDPTMSIQRKNNQIVKNLADKGYIEVGLKKSLTTYNSIAPRIYGLPKTHKMNAPLRPIVSFTKAPTYKLSKLLANIMSCASNEDVNVRNSHQLIARLRKIQLDIG